MKGFEWYSPRIGAPIVSIATYGLTFSSGAVEALGNAQFVMLGFDEEKGVIGVKACDEDNAKAIEFYGRIRNGYVRISNKDFIRFLESKMPEDFKVDSKAIKYFTRWDKENEILTVDLNQPMD